MLSRPPWQIKPSLARRLDACHHCTYIAYFGAVFIEGHGLYALVGGLMFLWSLVHILISASEESAA
jgi:hypothetical protein